jgi:hypothetical protein
LPTQLQRFFSRTENCFRILPAAHRGRLPYCEICRDVLLVPGGDIVIRFLFAENGSVAHGRSRRPRIISNLEIAEIFALPTLPVKIRLRLPRHRDRNSSNHTL